MIEIDGRTLEGGGQLLRIALSLSALLGEPFRIYSIRGNRGGGHKGGLKAAHLAAATWLAKSTKATTHGLELYSTELTFVPSKSIVQVFLEDPHTVWTDVYENGVLLRRESVMLMTTNGSIPLILQAIFPCLVRLPSAVPLRIKIQGGTNVSKSPSIDWVTQLFLPLICKQFNMADIDVTIHRRGWSIGGSQAGMVGFDIVPLGDGPQPALYIGDHAPAKTLTVTLLAPDIEFEQRVKEEVTKQLNETLSGVECIWRTEISGHSQRAYLLTVLELSNGFRLGSDQLLCRSAPKKHHVARQKFLENECRKLVSEVMNGLFKDLASKTCVDDFTEDQLVVFMALGKGRSEINVSKSPSLHTLTAQWVANKFLGTSFVKGCCDGRGV